MMSPIVVEFTNVSKYFGSKRLLENVNFALNKGELTTIIGPNGAGKTTIARMILGLEKPSSGSIKSTSKIKVGYVPQKLTFSEYLPISTEKFIKIFAPNPNQEIYVNIVNYLGLDKIRNDCVNNLSGGQLQKLLTAIALLNTPELLILDEPTQSLDLEARDHFYELLHWIRHTWSPTIVMISHDLLTVMKNSDLVICINGHVCCTGRAEEFKNNPALLQNLSTLSVYMHHHDHKHY